MPNENENTQETNENEAELEYTFNFNVPNVQPLDVTPSTESQEIYAPDGISGYSPVNVGAVDATIDANITADNIREGIEILGVEGDLIELKGQEKTVNPTTSAQNITPDNNFNGLTKVTVNAVTSSIDSDIQSQNILEGINILGVEGSVVELKGEERIVNLSNKDGQTFTPTGENNGITSIHVNPKNKNVTIQPQTVSQTIGIDDGFSGNGNITVNAVTKTIDTNIQSYNIKQGVEVLGVQGSVVELEGEDKTVTLNNKEGQTFTPSNGKNGLTSLTVIPHNENRTINPSTEFKTVEINEGYSGNGTLAVMPVTNAIDQNIKPQNIKQGVKILGVNGALPTVVNNTELTVNPTTEEQVITPAGNYTGFDEVTVNAVTSAIDENITAGNIKDGVTILGVTGEVVELNADSLSVTPTTSVQTITPTSPINGFNEVNVSAVTSSIDNNIKASNIKSGVTILGISGTVTELNGETKSVSLTDKSGQTFTPTSPKNAITSITVTPNNQARTVTPTTSQQSLSVNSGYSGNGTITVNAVTSSIDNNIQPENIKKDVVILGTTGTLESGGVQIKDAFMEIDNGTLAFSATVPLNFVLPSQITDLADYALAGLTNGRTNQSGYTNNCPVETADLSSLTAISGRQGLGYAFCGCTSLTSVDLSSLTTISGQSALSYAFCGCTSLTSVDLSSLTTISGQSALSYAFGDCTSLTSVDLSSLVSGTINGAFKGCTSLTSVDLSSLSVLTDTSSMSSAFLGCTSLTSLSFPALNSNSFGTSTYHFSYMLSGVTGCTVHFPSNLQSVIGSWTDVVKGFNGTNTTVLFDLPATT